jgi:hypothetical protein
MTRRAAPTGIGQVVVSETCELEFGRCAVRRADFDAEIDLTQR